MTAPTEAPHFPRFWPLFGIALAVRFGTVLVGIALAALPPDPYSDPRTPRQFHDEMKDTSAKVIEPWFRYDALWLMNVARNGYAAAEDEGGRLGVAFMPTMPATMATAEALKLNPFWVALIVANLAGAAGAAVFARVAVQLTGSRETGLRAFVLLLAFPASFFFSAPYNESFGLLFTSLALAAWLNRKTAQTAVFAAAGSLARMTGVALGLAALANWLFDDRTRHTFKRALLIAVGSLAGLALFWVYLGWAVGDPFAGLKSQAAWGRRGLSVWNPWYAIESIYDPRLPHWGEAFVVLGFGALGIRAWQRRGAFWSVLILAPVAQMMMSGTFLSGHRLILAALPGFIELADVLRKRVYFRVTVGLFALVQFVLLNRFVHWLFAG